jgi:2-polyprenyl-3-methyl-5-hydroxy-6-metoxy-1,4-benzoquinol methylase
VPDQYHVFLAVPNAGSIMPCAFTASHGATRNHKVSVCPLQFGDIEHNFNMLICECVRRGPEMGVTHFAMLHTDIGAVDGWLDILLDEMDSVGSDIMTTVNAIKDGRGVTTTGIRYPGAWGTWRLTMREVMDLPETFSFDDLDSPNGHLAINTGLWVAKIGLFRDRQFPGFTCKHKITWNDGPTAHFDSEDWLFSDWMAEQGIKAYATRKVNAYHRGAMDYPNQGAWGEWTTDLQAPARPVDERIASLPKPNITIETEHPIATDSLDHTQPLGTAVDNSVSASFNRKLFELIPAKQVRLLDLGCSGGGLVRSILESGGFAVGIEGSDFSRNANRAEWATIPEWLFTADVTKPFTLRNCVSPDPLKFNVITGWEFWEHIAEEDIPNVARNIRHHCTPNAIFIGSISQNIEPHHRTAQSKLKWMYTFGGWHSPEIEAHFGDCLVRGKNDPNAESFSFGMKVYA